MSERTKNRLLVLALFACVLLVGWIENTDDYEPLKPTVDAPVFVDWRTGELVTP